jgi:ubiquinone biosynthesis protein UbiJ
MLQLLPAVCCHLAETALNQLIALDPQSQRQLPSLQGRQIAFKVQEFPWRLVITAQPNGLWLNSHDEPVACDIRVKLSSLPALTDQSQITQLIRQDALQLDGDLATLQKFSAFFQTLDPDWEEALSRWLGDAMAYRVGTALRQIQRAIRDKFTQQVDVATALLQDELRLTPVQIEFDLWQHDIRQLNQRTEQLARHIQALTAEASVTPSPPRRIS